MWAKRKGGFLLINDDTKIGKNVEISPSATIYSDVIIENGVIIEANAVIYENTHIKAYSIIGPNTVIGHYTLDFWKKKKDYENRKTVIGKGCWVRSGTTIYSGNKFEDGVQTGDHAIVRENNAFGERTVIGTASHTARDCIVGKYVRIMNGTYITNAMRIGDYVFIGQNVTTTDDPYMDRVDLELTPPFIERAARIGGHVALLPGVNIGEEAVVGAGAVVTKDVAPYTIVVGVPARMIGTVPKEQYLNENAIESRRIFLRLP